MIVQVVVGLRPLPFQIDDAFNIFIELLNVVVFELEFLLQLLYPLLLFYELQLEFAQKFGADEFGLNLSS